MKKISDLFEAEDLKCVTGGFILSIGIVIDRVERVLHDLSFLFIF